MPKKPKFVIEAHIGPDDVELVDSGHAVICSVDDGAETGMFVRLQSWDTKARQIRDHPVIAQFVNRKVRVTVEVIE